MYFVFSGKYKKNVFKTLVLKITIDNLNTHY